MNETILGAGGVTERIDTATQVRLGPRGVNALRESPDRGLQASGARTLSADADWKYVDVRRLTTSRPAA